MMRTKNFAVLILTHGRPDNVVTYKTLRKQGYTGDIYIVVDNEDKTLNRYLEIYGDKVIVFDKSAVSPFDVMGEFGNNNSVVYARNASFKIAKDLGLKYFLQADDDYLTWDYRFSSDSRYYREMVNIKNLDSIFDTMLDYLAKIPALTIAMGQGGDFIGGYQSGNAQKIKTRRKAMNTFFCDVDRPFTFLGLLNDDVNTYVSHGNRGDIFLTLMIVGIRQSQTQQNAGGLTELYLDSGTYVKSFYTVMIAPSCVTIRKIGYIHRRLHHAIKWNNAVPKILSPEYRK